MNKALKLAMAAILSAGPLAGCVAAQTTGSVRPAASSDDGVTVIIIRDGLDDDEQTQQIPRKYRFPSPETVAAAQDEIKSDTRIRSILQGKSVQLRNVVGVQTAANGGKIVYVQ